MRCTACAVEVRESRHNLGRCAACVQREAPVERTGRVTEAKNPVIAGGVCLAVAVCRQPASVGRVSESPCGIGSCVSCRCLAFAGTAHGKAQESAVVSDACACVRSACEGTWLLWGWREMHRGGIAAPHQRGHANAHKQR